MTTIEQECVAVLLTADAKAKAAAGLALCRQWRNNPVAPAGPPVFPPDRPSRPERPSLLQPKEMPRRRLGSEHGRIALLHSLAHIELNAIDLAFDMIARFIGEHWQLFGDPSDFVRDWLQVAEEECNHFNLLSDRLKELGSFYGDLPAHDGLWQAAYDTKADWLGRIAVVPLVLEARGLDVSPPTIDKLTRLGDTKSAQVLNFIYEEEIGHVAIGIKWFKKVCKAQNLAPEATYHELVRRYFGGKLKPPFNDLARKNAGFLPNFYLPLAG